jgi:hypothetical protein
LDDIKTQAGGLRMICFVKKDHWDKAALKAGMSVPFPIGGDVLSFKDNRAMDDGVYRILLGHFRGADGRVVSEGSKFWIELRKIGRHVNSKAKLAVYA